MNSLKESSMSHSNRRQNKTVATATCKRWLILKKTHAIIRNYFKNYSKPTSFNKNKKKSTNHFRLPPAKYSVNIPNLQFTSTVHTDTYMYR